MTAVQFGAGNIGRGFLGQLYFESGYRTIFIDVAEPVVRALNQRGRYTVRVVGDRPRDIEVQNVLGILTSDADAVRKAVFEADVMGTSVGVAHLEAVARLMAPGIGDRLRQNRPPVDVLLCENKLNAAEYMRFEIAKCLPMELLGLYTEKVGFVEASIGRMVPVMSPEQRAADPLLVCVEEYCELPVDAEGFRGPIPPIRHLLPKKPFTAYIERKLFVHNAGHATAAYLGHLRDHEYVWQAMEDPRVRPVVDAAMTESCQGLHRKYSTPMEELNDHAEDLKRRFSNKALGDQVVRVGGDPLRKLGHDDRLIGAMEMCLSQGVDPVALAIGTAAALRFDAKGDPSAARVQEAVRNSGVEGALTTLCGINPDSRLIDLVSSAFMSLDSLLCLTNKVNSS